MIDAGTEIDTFESLAKRGRLGGSRDRVANARAHVYMLRQAPLGERSRTPCVKSPVVLTVPVLLVLGSCAL